MLFPCASQRLLPRYANIPYTPLTDRQQPTPRQRFIKGTFKILLSIALIVASITTFCLVHNARPLEHLQRPLAPVPVIPKDFRTVGLVFYGRRDRVEVLDCYLKQNLKRNSGPLDEIIFLARTSDSADLAYLDALVASTPGYSRYNVTRGSNYGEAWEVAERGVMYIKIDDDVMFIERGAIASLIAMKRAHPEHLLISTNTINSPRLAWLHSHLGAIHPFLPDPSPPPRPSLPSLSSSQPLTKNRINWRPSLLPPWPGNPLTYRFPSHPPPPALGASEQKQRWLPLSSPYNSSLTGTPASQLQYEDSTQGLRNWAIAAQQHYSFLLNHEKGELWRHGKRDDGKESLWRMQGARIQINLICLWGDDIVASLPVPADDEKYFTVELPKRWKREAVVDLNAVSVHFAFRHQRRGMEGTDLLGRYKSLAEESCTGAGVQDLINRKRQMIS
ncbi:MAG: hypothetical protein Q9168_006874 [Polycauliona sp. 1 TL-2023]